MNAVVICVAYSDFLRWTLPVNRKHFSRIVVVTDLSDDATVEVALANDVDVIRTSVFTDSGATFAKYAGIELGLDHIGREGWITLLDADVLIPKTWDQSELHPGNLYCPLRRMCKDYPPPPESKWREYPIDSVMRGAKEYPPPDWFLGYMHTFHASDPHLGVPPWHGHGHNTAARGDMVFFQKWPLRNRIRPSFEVLHIGEERQNWYGRRTPEYGTPASDATGVAKSWP